MRLSRHGISPLPVWSSEQIYFSATRWFSDIQRDISSAQHTICLQTYIFNIDAVGEPLLEALCAASRRGVKVRVIADGVGSANSIVFLQNMLQKNDAELHVYHPLPWQWIVDRLERDNWVARFFERLMHVNNRQHSKLFLIDGCIAWTGSFNITDDHIENNGRGLDWKDCGVRVSGKRCLLLDEFFNAVWKRDIRLLSPYFLFHPATNFSPALRRRRLRVLLQNIHGAQQRIWIISAYFSPIQRIVRALKKASLRGVDVRIMVPAHSDVRFFPALASTYYADMLRAGIHIHEYEEGILHSKIILIDDAPVVGSSNMNHRSALHDVELDIDVFSKDSIRQIEEDFSFSIKKCRDITLENINSFYAWLLAFGQVPRLLRYWL